MRVTGTDTEKEPPWSVSAHPTASGRHVTVAGPLALGDEHRPVGLEPLARDEHCVAARQRVVGFDRYHRAHEWRRGIDRDRRRRGGALPVRLEVDAQVARDRGTVGDEVFAHAVALDAHLGGSGPVAVERQLIRCTSTPVATPRTER